MHIHVKYRRFSALMWNKQKKIINLKMYRISHRKKIKKNIMHKLHFSELIKFQYILLAFFKIRMLGIDSDNWYYDSEHKWPSLRYIYARHKTQHAHTNILLSCTFIFKVIYFLYYIIWSNSKSKAIYKPLKNLFIIFFQWQKSFSILFDESSSLANVVFDSSGTLLFYGKFIIAKEFKIWSSNSKLTPKYSATSLSKHKRDNSDYCLFKCFFLLSIYIYFYLFTNNFSFI